MHKIVNKKGIIYVLGSLSKYGTLEAKGTDSYLSIRQSIVELEASKSIDEIAIYIDSPGGQVDGLFDTADLIKDSIKHTSAFISGCGCSAAYLIASQCNIIYAEQGSIVGSIGVLKALQDTSKQDEIAGIKNIVIASGIKKGRLNPGSEITNEDISSIQSKVTYFADLFASYVKQGRNMNDEEIKNIKDGDSYIAEEAIDYKLIDGLVKYTDFVAGTIEMKKEPMEAEVAEVAEVLKAEVVEVVEDNGSEVEELKKIIEDLKKQIEDMKNVAEPVAEEDDKEDEDEEDEPEITASLSLIDSYMLASGNDKDLVLEAISKKYTIEQVIEKAESKLVISNLKTYNKNNDKDMVSKLLPYCDSEADAIALADFYKSENKN